MQEDESLPQHIAIIMDGNGRWAKQRGLPRHKGHEAGADSVREITRACARRHIGQLTLYAFSTENWSRPKQEVAYLMRLLRRYLIQERSEIMENNIRFRVIGDVAALPGGVRRAMDKTIEMSAGNTGTTLCLALNYGGRDEIVRAVRTFAEDVAAGRRSPGDLDETAFGQYLDTDGMPDLDLLIRTASEMRISNFLLWQLSYAELWVTPVSWPDFREPQLQEALEAYVGRERRFGGIKNENEQSA